MTERSYLGIGIYDFAQADHLVGAKPGSVSRWVLGYERRKQGDIIPYLPVVRADNPDLAELGVITFRELIECHLIAAFRRHNVPMPAIREASTRLAEQFNVSHPLALRDLHTDGKHIFVKTNELWKGDDQVIMELPHMQRAMDFVESYFMPNLDYGSDDYAIRYWPNGRDEGIILDPMRQFGQPILDQFRVPTASLYEMSRAGEPLDAIADWFDIPVPAVEAAIRFENSLHRKATAA